ncbi:MAG: hypothetical protein ACREOQ_03635 [Gemmatimonadales bacterium]
MNRRAVLGWSLLATGCGVRAVTTPPPTPGFRFEVIGNASPADTGGPTLRIDSQVVTIRGIAIQTEGVGLYGDLDLSQPHTVRLTLYDSLSGRPVDDPLPPAGPSHLRQVLYEARIGPLRPGTYDVWIGRFDATARMVEVAHEPLRITVPPAPRRRNAESDSGH